MIAIRERRAGKGGGVLNKEEKRFHIIQGGRWAFRTHEVSSWAVMRSNGKEGSKPRLRGVKGGSGRLGLETRST